MRNLIKTDFDKLYEDLSTINDSNKEPDFYSPMVKDVIDRIDRAIGSWGYISFWDGTIDNNDIWTATIEITDNDNYEDNEIVDPAYNAESVAQNSLTPEQRNYTNIYAIDGDNLKVSIDLLRVPDNTFTADDLDKYGKDPEVTARLNELEKRMFRWAGDERTTTVRMRNLKAAKDYENELVRLSDEGKLNGITDLQFKDRDNSSFSVKPVQGSDFICKIPPQTKDYNVEGKSYFLWKKDPKTNKVLKQSDGKFIPIDFEKDKNEFIDRFKELVDTKAFGSLHTNDTDYILFVNKANGQIVCIDIKDFNNCWLAGKTNLNFIA